jgi:hypothetical protein
MDKCYDQRIDESYTNQNPENNSDNNENPYRLSFLKPSDKRLERRVLITDEIRDDENFEDDGRSNSGSSCFSKN